MTAQLDNSRISYIDAIKGFSILWVVIYHLGEVMPEWVLIPYRMPLFFFLSGIFFRQRSLKVFFTRRVNTLLVPLAFWLVVTYVFWLFRYELFFELTPNRPEVQPDATWGHILGVFKLFNIHNKQPYAGPFLGNDPLWFLLCLFNVQIIYYGIRSTISKWYYILPIGLTLYFIGFILTSKDINGVFILNNTLKYILYYACGSLFGEKLIEIIKSRTNKIAIFVVCLTVLIVLNTFDLNVGLPEKYWNFFILNICIAVFVPLVFVVFSVVGDAKFLAPLRFFGQNSLVVLATHGLVFIAIDDIFIYLLNAGTPDQLKLSIYFQLFRFITVCIADYFLIKLCNKYIPIFIGKKSLLK